MGKLMFCVDKESMEHMSTDNFVKREDLENMSFESFLFSMKLRNT